MVGLGSGAGEGDTGGDGESEDDAGELHGGFWEVVNRSRRIKKLVDLRVIDAAIRLESGREAQLNLTSERWGVYISPCFSTLWTLYSDASCSEQEAHRLYHCLSKSSFSLFAYLLF